MTHMDECTPPILPSVRGLYSFYIKVEYFHKHIVGEHVDCHQAYIGRVSVCSGHCITAYLDLVLDQTLPGDIQNGRPS